MGVGDPSFDAYAYGTPNVPLARPVIRFGAIGEAWRLFWERPVTWTLAGLVVLAANSFLNVMIVALFGRGVHVVGAGFRANVPVHGRLADVLLSAILNGFLLGGLFRMACLQVRGQRFDVGDLFGVIDVWKELAIGSAVFGAACFAAGMFCALPAFVAAGVLMFTFPLIVDGRFHALEAIGGSWSALKGQWLAATAFHTVVLFLSGAGGCLCGIGLLLTLPLYCLSVASLYRHFFVAKGQPDAMS